MGIDREAAAAFMAAHARLLDRRRFDGGDVLAALEGYANDDGGYGSGLEPDLRARGSQPSAAFHAFEVMAEAAPETTRSAERLCDWLASVTLADGGVPFALPVDAPAGCAPFWVDADPTASSLQITSLVARHGHRVARHDPAVAAHPWLARARTYCLEAIDALDAEPHALVLAFSVQFLDDVHDDESHAPALLERLARFVPADGLVHVEGGTDEEFMRPLDFAPEPGRPARSLLSDAAVAADLDRLEQLQQPDGGWPVEWVTYSPAAALEWRGYLTERAVRILRANGR